MIDEVFPVYHIYISNEHLEFLQPLNLQFVKIESVVVSKYTHESGKNIEAFMW